MKIKSLPLRSAEAMMASNGTSLTIVSLPALTPAASAAVDFSELSMGTSTDYKVAIEEGATMVRVGTAIVGPRQYT